jgi:hypothetical protein
MSEFRVGQFVAVSAADGVPGVVQYLTPDGGAGVMIVGEKGRIDEWHPSQLTPLTPREAAARAMETTLARFMR